MNFAKSYLIPILCFASAGAVTLFAVTSSGSRARTPSAVSAALRLGALADREIAPSARRLLDLAFEAASKLPDDPHIKNKARNQELVVDTCITLELPVRALERAEAMSTWRRGNALAALAVFAARRGAALEADDLIRRANECADEVLRRSQEEQTAQGWQHDHIAARVAQANRLLGREGDSAAGLSEVEAGGIAAARAELVVEAGFEAELHSFDAALAAGSVETTQGVLEGCTKLYRTFYADAKKHAVLEERFSSAWKGMPLQLRVESTLELAAIAAGAGDYTNARRLVVDAETAFDSVAWPVEDRVTLGARLGAAWARAGDAETARARLEKLTADFDAHRASVYDVFRARPLRSLAEAWGALGDEPARRREYARALEEGASNPNGRPRVDDLVATCCSMARSGFEPDTALWERIERVRASLASPW